MQDRLLISTLVLIVAAPLLGKELLLAAAINMALATRSPRAEAARLQKKSRSLIDHFRREKCEVISGSAVWHSSDS